MTGDDFHLHAVPAGNLWFHIRRPRGVSQFINGKNEAQLIRRRDNNTITRGGKINIKFSPILRANIQIFKNGIFYRNKDIWLKTAGGYYAYIGRTSSIILTGCLRVSGVAFDNWMRILTRRALTSAMKTQNGIKKIIYERLWDRNVKKIVFFKNRESRN